MFKKLGLSILCLAATLSSPSYAVTQNHALQAWATLEYELPHAEAQIFSNIMFWAVEAHCKITTEDNSNTLYVVALAKQGKINDIPLKKGESTRVTVHNGDILKINADSGAKVSMTNEGNHTVKALCTTTG